MADAGKSIVVELEERWRTALLAKDHASLRDLIHPDYELVGMRSTGFLSIGLERWMEALDSMDLASIETRVVNAVVLPHTIVATLEACWKVRYRGQCIDERVLISDVWVREGDRWQVLRRHSSLIPAGVEIP